MRSLLSSRRLRRLMAACALLFVVLAALGLWIVETDAAQREAADHRLLASYAAEVRAELEDEIYRSLNLARGLRAFVVAYPRLADQRRLKVLLEALYEQGQHIRNVGLAPKNVIEIVYPLAGNRAVIGLNYRDLPGQFDAVRRAMRIRGTVLAGPVDLVQGGRGLINRTPVFLRDGSYWGVVSLVLDVDSPIDAVHADTARLPITWAARALRSGEPPAFIGGDRDAFSQADSRSSAAATFEVPDGTWEIMVLSSEAPGSLRPWLLTMVALLAALALSALVFQTVRGRWRATDLSLHDSLTGLPNRRLLDDRLRQALAVSNRSGEPLAIVFVDLDRFKLINDRHGHEAGDHTLKVIAGRIAARIRETDTVARVGGDEFVVLLPGTDGSGASVIVTHIEDAVARPIHWGGGELSVGVSCGLAVSPRDGGDPDTLLSYADGSMYAVKEQRRGRVTVPSDGSGPTVGDESAGTIERDAAPPPPR